MYLHCAINQDTMSSKFQNKYRIPTARWQSWNYSSEGLYFITINAVHHECLFGSIVDKEMHLSAYGQINFYSQSLYNKKTANPWAH